MANELIILEEYSKDLTKLEGEELRTLILNIEAKCKEVEQTEIPLKHHFSKGVYAREIFIPKGTLVVGKIHKHENLNVISKGEISVMSVDGIFKIEAPYTFVSAPGAKRVGYTHEDTIWITFHGTDETDLDKIEEEFICKTYEDFDVKAALEVEEIKCLG